MSPEKNSVPKLEKQEDCKVYSLLDLPEWALNCILERLSPQDLCMMAQVCTCLRNRSRSDDLWEKQVNQKWSRLIGDVANQEWLWHTTKINTESLLLQQNQSGSCGSFSGVWPSLNLHSYLENFRDLISLFKNCSKLTLFICLESGRFWFPVQVYKSAPLYCYDATVSYDSRTDTFRARSPTGGWRMIEENIQWDRLRLSSVETFPRGFYTSNSLNDLKPGDHIEIQRRKRKELPYDMLVVEFKQYHLANRWRRSVLNRNVNEEQGSRLCWLGGIRKLDKEEEIEKWNSLFLSRNHRPFIHGHGHHFRPIIHGQFT